MRHRLPLLALCVCACGKTSPPTTASPAATSAAEAPPADERCLLVEEGAGPAGTVPIATQTVASGLEVPWGIGFLSPTEILVTERPGRVRLVRDGQLLPEPVATIRTSAQGEGGLLGLALHPDFAQNRYFYVYYTADTPRGARNRVERWRLSEDATRAEADTIVLGDIPASKYHNGGRLRFGPDGRLYIGTGDAREPALAQDPSSLAGKILRIEPDGTIPADNPTPGSPVFILGVRNTQGFDWVDADTLRVTDHGPTGELGLSGHDEVSTATRGSNLGWPTIYGCETKEPAVAPDITWRQAVPPGGAAIYTGTAIPEWQGDLLIGALGARHLHHVAYAADGTVEQHAVYLEGELGRVREAIMGPDGELYLTTSNCDDRGTCPPEKDRIVRVTRASANP